MPTRRVADPAGPGKIFTIFAACLVLSAGCARGPSRAAQILARPEAPLMSRPVKFQRMTLGDAEESRLTSYLQRRPVLVTPAEIALPGGDSGLGAPRDFVLSFAVMTGVEVKSLAYRPIWPLKGGTLDQAVVISETRGLCYDGCVFVFEEEDGGIDTAATERFVSLVRDGMARVDPFGRTDGPRPVGVAAGLRSARPVWPVAPLRFEAEADRRLQAAFEDASFAFARDRLTGTYRDCLMSALTGEDPPPASPAYSFLPIDDIGVNYRAQLSTRSVLRSAALSSTGVTSLLVSDVHSIQARATLSESGALDAVELTLRAFVDFFDLQPLKDGAYFWHTHTATHPLADLDASVLEAEVLGLCRAVADEVRVRLAAER